jgi:L-alanine-DL-glutamate epimerase-like enolase superfamily enzyme
MELRLQEYVLRLKHPFRIARGVRETVPTVLVAFEHDGIVGYGEASPSPRYGESVDGTIRFLRSLDLRQFSSPFLLEDILQYADDHEEGHHAAKCALDIALHDWTGKFLGVALHKIFGLDPRKAAPSSFTIGAGSREETIRKLHEAEAYPILKIKLGTEYDVEMMTVIRDLTDQTLYVDANEGWKDRDLAARRVEWLEKFNILFVEQPMPAAQWEDMAWLKERSPLPLMADESVSRLKTLPAVAQVYDGINIKLMKSTGLREAGRMIAYARATNLKVMLGCMIESSIGISAAAQLSPLADYADLDGNLLITNDPCAGAGIRSGRLTIPETPGIGVSGWNDGPWREVRSVL